MGNKLGAGAFKQASDLLNTPEKAGVWVVCEDYDYVSRGDEVRARFAYDLEEHDDRWWIYRPLEQVPELYLKFARLHKAPDFRQAALDFTREYGLPDGPHDNDPHYPGVVVTPDRLSLCQFRAEVRRAWAILSMYEAVLNGDARAAIELLVEHRDDGLFGEWHESFGEDPVKDRLFLSKSPRLALAFGLKSTVLDTKEVVDKFCRQRAHFCFDIRNSSPAPSDVSTTWQFDNLLGAMYLQMYWLMTAGGRLTRCESCGDVISLGRSKPGARKPPKHKRFCDNVCWQAAYRKRKKP